MMIRSGQLVEVSVADSVGTILLNRQEKRNAVSLVMAEQLREALGDLHAERRVRSVVVTGKGTAFCAGRDLHEMHAGHQLVDSQGETAAPSEWGDEAELFRDLLVDMLEFPKPLIASVNGPAVGYGAGLVLACDLAIACETAFLRLPEVRLGLVAGLVTPLVAFRAGASLASRLALTADSLPASELVRFGILSEIVTENALWARASEIGRELSAAAPQALGLTKRLLVDGIGERLLTELTSGTVASATARTTPAAREGVRAFVEKRLPNWDAR